MSRSLNQVEAYQFARYQADHQAAEAALEEARNALHGHQWRLHQDGVTKKELARLRGVPAKTITAELKPYEAAAKAAAEAAEGAEAEKGAEEAADGEDAAR